MLRRLLRRPHHGDVPRIVFNPWTMSIAVGARPTSREWPAACAAGLLLVVWVYTIYSFWQYAGLFAWLGVDYAVFWASARALLSHGPAAAYDQVVTAEAVKAL